jgi:hypothetical protein
MKNLVILFALFPLLCAAQDSTKKFHIGPSLGIDLYTADNYPYDIKYYSKDDIRGVTAGVNMAFTLGRRMSIHSGLLYRSISFKFMTRGHINFGPGGSQPGAPELRDKAILSSCRLLTVPLRFSYTWEKRLPFFIAAGGSLEYLYRSKFSGSYNDEHITGSGLSFDIGGGLSTGDKNSKFTPALRAGYMMMDNGKHLSSSGNGGLTLYRPFASIELAFLIGVGK